MTFHYLRIFQTIVRLEDFVSSFELVLHVSAADRFCSAASGVLSSCHDDAAKISSRSTPQVGRMCTSRPVLGCSNRLETAMPVRSVSTDPRNGI